jgi:integrase/recombinase XerD
MAASVSVLSVPTVTIYVRHGAACCHKENHVYKGKSCKCRKRLRWSHDGKQRDVSAKTRSWAEAEKAKQQVLAQLGGDPTKPIHLESDSRMTIAAAAELFLSSKSEQVAEGVLKKYERELKRLEEFMSKHSKHVLAAIEEKDIILFQKGWSKVYKSKQTRRSLRTRYREFFRYCKRKKWVDDVPDFDKIPKDTAKDRPTLPLSAEQYDALLVAIPETFADTRKAQRVRAIVQLMRYSGLAIRDAVTLERSELIRDAERDVYRIVTSRTKTGTHISVPIADSDVSKELLSVPNDNKRYFFWNTGEGKPQSAVTNWQHDLRELFRAAGFPEGHPHQLRDSFAVGLLEDGVPMEKVSKALGHESIKTTEKYYAKWNKGQQDALDDYVLGNHKRTTPV